MSSDSLLPQKGRQHLGHGGIVVDQEHRWLRSRHPGRDFIATRLLNHRDMHPAPHRSAGIAARLTKRYPRITETYFTFDRRSLGLARIYLGCLLLYDLFRRVPGLTTWYTNDGLLPNHTHLWRPAAPQMFSLF